MKKQAIRKRIWKDIHLWGMYVLMTAFLFLSPPQGTAQHLEVTPFGGYMFGVKIKGTSGDFRIRDDVHFGGSLSYGLRHDLHLQFSYLRKSSEAQRRSTGIVGYEDIFDIVTEYYQVGLVKEAWASFSSSGVFIPKDLVTVNYH